jgi:hypothetical protein
VVLNRRGNGKYLTFRCSGGPDCERCLAVPTQSAETFVVLFRALARASAVAPVPSRWVSRWCPLNRRRRVVSLDGEAKMPAAGTFVRTIPIRSSSAASRHRCSMAGLARLVSDTLFDCGPAVCSNSCACAPIHRTATITAPAIGPVARSEERARPRSAGTQTSARPAKPASRRSTRLGRTSGAGGLVDLPAATNGGTRRAVRIHRD